MPAFSSALVFALLVAAAHGDSTCANCQEAEPERGSALLQLQRAHSPEGSAPVKVALQEDDARHERIPLTEEGFDEVNQECCLLQSDLWLRRFIPTIGLELCDDGGLNGFLPFISCNGNMTFDKLQTSLQEASTSTCAWVKKTGECQLLPASCMGVYDPAAHRRRDCKTTTTVPDELVCCKKAAGRFIEVEKARKAKKGLVQTDAAMGPDRHSVKYHHKQLIQANATEVRVQQPPQREVKPIDCKANKMPLQVMMHDDVFKVRSLEVDTGIYTDVFTIPADRTSPALKSVNSCAINPLDDTLYCTLLLPGKGDYLVRIDDAKVKFVALLPWKGNAAAFSTAGVYYWSGSKGFAMLKGVADLDDFDDPAKALNAQDTKIHETNYESHPDDFVALSGVDFDDSMDIADYLIGLQRKNMVVTKVTEKGFQKTWKVPVKIEGNPSGGYGAAWEFQGRLFFANNAGNGVFELHPDDVNAAKENSKVKLKKVGHSDKSGQNDGANCLKEEPPFPDRGDCDFGYFEVEPVNGECPEGSEPEA